MWLVTGCNGQLGQTLRAFIPDAIGTTSQELDITDRAAVHAFVTAHNIDTIINCAAYTAVDKAEDEADKAFAVNVTGVANLASTGAHLVHISTDYVYSGQHYLPYTENDPAEPQSLYGKTKLQGEQAALEHGTTVTVIRSSWLYSIHGHNFLKTMLRLGEEKNELNVVCDQIGTPTFSDDLARAMLALIPTVAHGSKEIYNFSNEGVCSWYDFAHAIMQATGRDCHINPISSKEYRTKAQRPAYSVLDKTKIKQKTGIIIPHWTEGLTACLKQFS